MTSATCHLSLGRAQALRQQPFLPSKSSLPRLRGLAPLPTLIILMPRLYRLSRPTRFLLQRVQHWPLLYSILVERDSRRIFYFMMLNFAFMLVQTFYGIATGSLGLLSDSIHMLFDCLALFVGLCAAVMSKWPPSVRFPYGLGKMDTLAGFANGIFLMYVNMILSRKLRPATSMSERLI